MVESFVYLLCLEVKNLILTCIMHHFFVSSVAMSKLLGAIVFFLFLFCNCKEYLVLPDDLFV